MIGGISMRNIAFLLLFILITISGCSGGDETVAANNQNSPDNELNENNDSIDSSNEEVDKKESKYVFQIDNISIPMHAEAAPILEQLGNPSNYFEAEACAFPGLEKVYTFSGFDIYTYEKDDVDYIASVVLTDDTVATSEGVYLFSNGDEVFETYGEDYTQDLVSYTYEDTNAQLVFLIEDEEVTSIEYIGTIE